VKDNKTITLVPLTPRQVYEDQVKLKRENELKTNCESESSKKKMKKGVKVKKRVKRKKRVKGKKRVKSQKSEKKIAGGENERKAKKHEFLY
jgi:hypothetical protein